MRALSIYLAAAALLTTVSTAHADAGLVEPGHVTTQQMAQVTGVYRLSDGRRAELYVLDGRLYVRIGRGQQKEVDLAGTDCVASSDGKISIQFGSEPDTDRIVLTQDPAIIRQDTIRLASNEREGRGSAN